MGQPGHSTTVSSELHIRQYLQEPKMKLFLLAAVIAVSSAARLEHLERSYLPPDSSNSISGHFGSQGSNGIGSGQFGASARGSHGFNGTNGRSGVDNGFSGSLNGFGSNNNGVDGLKQYLPPLQPASGSNFGFAKQSSFGAQAPSSQYGQPRFGAQAPSTQYGQPQFAAQANQHGQPIGAPSHQFGSQRSQGQAQFGVNSQYNQFAPSGPSGGSNGFGSRYAQDQSAANRQYLAPKTQEPQQPFDEKTGYQY